MSKNYTDVKALSATGQRIKTAGEGTPKDSPCEKGGGTVTGGKYGSEWMGRKGLGGKVKINMKEYGKDSY